MLSAVMSQTGRIPAFDLVCLEDDKHFFPPYYAVPLVKQETLDKYPELEGVIEELSGKISDDLMRELNSEVDIKKRPAKEVAEEFLIKEGLIFLV